MCALALMRADQGQYILKVRILVLVTFSLSLNILCSYWIYQIGLLISLLDLSLLLDIWCLLSSLDICILLRLVFFSVSAYQCCSGLICLGWRGDVSSYLHLLHFELIFTSSLYGLSLIDTLLNIIFFNSKWLYHFFSFSFFFVFIFL